MGERAGRVGRAVLEGIAAFKIADFAGEAHAADADVLARSYTSEAKRPIGTNRQVLQGLAPTGAAGVAQSAAT